MVRRSFVENWIGLVSRFGLVFLSLLLSLALISTDSYAQKKKKKGNNHEVELEAQKQAYMQTLMRYYSFGWENYKNKQYPDAVKWFWKVSEIDTINKFTKLYRYLGDSYFKMEKADSAKIIFEMGSEKYPDDAFLHRMVGYFLAQTEQVDEAIPRYERVIELQPESIDDFKQLATLYVKADRIEDAIGVYDKIVALDPNDLSAQENLSQLILSTGDIGAGLESMEKVREQNLENSQVRFELGKLYFDQGDYEVSIERFNEFLTLIPNDAQALSYIGTSLLRLERYSDAVTEFKKILDIEPENTKVMTDISSCYKEMGSFVSARTYANNAIAIDRGYGLGWIALGEVYETCADRCVDNKRGEKKGKIEFDDKLVYELAYRQYRKALPDLAFKNEAEKRISYVRGVLPTTEDKFMNKGQKQAKGQCYAWIY